jgi:hypothetical protein
MKELDRDGSGFIEFDEFVFIIQRFFMEIEKFINNLGIGIKA